MRDAVSGATIVVVERIRGLDTIGALVRSRLDRPYLEADSVGHMVEVVLEALGGRALDRLDLIGHGRPGKMAVGSGRMLKDGRKIDVREHTWAPLRALPWANDARGLRLLGCMTGAGERGQALLQTLAEGLGVPVEAPVDGMPYLAYEADGLSPEVSARLARATPATPPSPACARPRRSPG